MDKIYVVTYDFDNHESWEDNYYGTDKFFGVFSTEEKAKEAIMAVYAKDKEKVEKLQKEEIKEYGEQVEEWGSSYDIGDLEKLDASSYTYRVYGVVRYNEEMEYIFTIKEVTIDDYVPMQW